MSGRSGRPCTSARVRAPQQLLRARREYVALSGGRCGEPARQHSLQYAVEPALTATAALAALAADIIAPSRDGAACSTPELFDAALLLTWAEQRTPGYG